MQPIESRASRVSLAASHRGFLKVKYWWNIVVICQTIGTIIVDTTERVEALKVHVFEISRDKGCCGCM